MTEDELEFECTDCFVNFRDDRLKIPAPPILCPKCRSQRVNHDSLKLLKRRMEALENTQIWRFPQIMQHLFRHISLKKEPT